MMPTRATSPLPSRKPARPAASAINSAALIEQIKARQDANTKSLAETGRIAEPLDALTTRVLETKKPAQSKSRAKPQSKSRTKTERKAEPENKPVQFDATGRMMRPEPGAAPDPTPPLSERKSVLSLKERKNAILENKRVGFNVAINPTANSEAPWYEFDVFSQVKKHKDLIEKEAKKADLDVDLVKAIVHIETTHGFYDAPLDAINLNKSVRPMNVNANFWKGLGFSREDLKNPEQNIKAGVMILKRIKKQMPNASAEQIATIYNNLGAKGVTDYGARVGSLLEEKPWGK